MFPTHPDTVRAISVLDHQERLRKAEKARIAASAQGGGRSPLTSLRTARPLVASWLRGIVTLQHGAMQAPASPPLAGAQKQPSRLAA